MHAAAPAAATTGVFLLRSTARRRPYVDTFPALAHSWRAAFFADRSLATSARLHVLVHDGDVADIAAKWAADLGPAAAVFGGAHLVRPGRPPRRPSDLNYLRKIFAALAIARRNGYDVLISLDDDVLLAPAAILAFLRDGAYAVRETRDREAPCAMVTPTVSTGIPTVHRFADDFFPEDVRRRLEDCYGAALAGAAPLVEKLGGPWRNAAFDEEGWWALLWEKAPDFLYENLTSVGLGVHPVRFNKTCTAAVGEASLGLIAAHFGAAREAVLRGATAASLEIPPPGAFPYLANSVWATAPAKLEEALAAVDPDVMGHPFDEAPMSTMWLHERRRPLCVVRRAFALHPEYGGSGLDVASGAFRDGLEATLHRAAFGALLLRASLDRGLEPPSH